MARGAVSTLAAAFAAIGCKERSFNASSRQNTLAATSPGGELVLVLPVAYDVGGGRPGVCWYAGLARDAFSTTQIREDEDYVRAQVAANFEAGSWVRLPARAFGEYMGMEARDDVVAVPVDPEELTTALGRERDAASGDLRSRLARAKELVDAAARDHDAWARNLARYPNAVRASDAARRQKNAYVRAYNARVEDYNSIRISIDRLEAKAPRDEGALRAARASMENGARQPFAKRSIDFDPVESLNSALADALARRPAGADAFTCPPQPDVAWEGAAP